MSKFISYLAVATGNALPNIVAKNIIVGLEPEQTNLMLQILAETSIHSIRKLIY